MPMCADPEVADVRQTVILPGLKISATCWRNRGCQQEACTKRVLSESVGVHTDFYDAQSWGILYEL